MSTGQATRDTWDTLKELLDRTEAQVRKEVNQAAPVVRRSVGASIEAATRGFDSTMKKISHHTETEQLELLKAYHRFLSGQIDFVDSRLKELEHHSQTRPEAPART